jgi:outer membrane immunogenic protein
MRSGLFLALLAFGFPFHAQGVSAAERTLVAAGNYNWTGMYVGAHVGPQNFSSDGFGDLFFLDDTTHVSGDGTEAGGQLGFNKQFGRVVVGFEASGSWNSANENANCFANYPDVDEITGHLILEHHVARYLCQSNFNWTADGLAKLGYTFDDGRLLPYAIGGFAVSAFQTRFSRYMSDELPALIETSHFAYDTGEQNLTGAVFGGGVQYAVGFGVSIGVEYLHTDYGRESYKGQGQGIEDFSSSIHTAVDFSASGHNDLRTDEVRAVLNYKFSE